MPSHAVRDCDSWLLHHTPTYFSFSFFLAFLHLCVKHFGFIFPGLVLFRHTTVLQGCCPPLLLGLPINPALWGWCGSAPLATLNQGPFSSYKARRASALVFPCLFVSVIPNRITTRLEPGCCSCLTKDAPPDTLGS